MDKRLWLVLIVGILIRILLAFVTYHSDIQTFQFGGQVIGSGNILNFYDYQSSLSDQKLKEVSVFNYPPAIYLFQGVFNFLFSSIGLGVINDFLFDKVTIFENVLFGIHLLLIKLPYLLFDIPLAFLLRKFFNEKKEKDLAFILWIFNPVNLYATYMVGQFDVIPTFLVVSSLVLITKRKLGLAALLLGLGAAFKIYPLFFVIPLAILGKNWWERLKIFILGILPYLLFILPFLSSSGYRSTALLANQTFKSFYAGIPVSGGESILLFPLFILFVYLYLFYQKQNISNLWKSFMIILLIFFIFTHYHPQWFLWLTPFLVIDLIYSKFKNWVLVAILLVSFTLSIFLFEPGLNMGLFGPLAQNLYQDVSWWQMLRINLDINFLRSISQTMLAAVGFYYLYLIFRDLKSNPN